MVTPQEQGATQSSTPYEQTLERDALNFRVYTLAEEISNLGEAISMVNKKDRICVPCPKIDCTHAPDIFRRFIGIPSEKNHIIIRVYQKQTNPLNYQALRECGLFIQERQSKKDYVWYFRINIFHFMGENTGRVICMHNSMHNQTKEGQRAQAVIVGEYGGLSLDAAKRTKTVEFVEEVVHFANDTFGNGFAAK